MKKIIAIAIIALTLGSCSSPNIQTPQLYPNMDVPTLITQLAESKRDSLINDTTGVVLNRSFDDGKHWIYEYKITKQKSTLIRAIRKEDEYGSFLIMGMIIGGLIIGGIFNALN